MLQILDSAVLRNRKKTLFFFSTAYPFGEGEAFVKTEIDRASEHFEQVLLFPFEKRGTKERKIPNGVELVHPLSLSISDKLIAILRNLTIVFHILRVEFRATETKLFFLRKITKWLSRIGDALLLSVIIKETIVREKMDVQDSIFYAFWMKEWALSLAILKFQNQIEHFVFRCNGIDIYDERRDANYMPFKVFNYSMSEKVIPNSKTSARYLVEKGIYSEKISPFYLGTEDHGRNPFNPDYPFLLVSCSNTSPVKRLALIPEILKHIKFNIKWLHIGGQLAELGSIKEQMEKLPSNIQADFTGYIEDQQHIFELYRQYSINLFINTSYTEGLPVSIQEAISFGIPCIATDVGGVNEVVNKSTGILIKKNFNPKVVASQISEFATSEMNTKTFRQGVRTFWEETFHSPSIYPSFINLITP